MGEKVIHANFGEGEVTHTFGSGEKISIAVKFIGMGSKSWITPGPNRTQAAILAAMLPVFSRCRYRPSNAEAGAAARGD